LNTHYFDGFGVTLQRVFDFLCLQEQTTKVARNLISVKKMFNLIQSQSKCQ